MTLLFLFLYLWHTTVLGNGRVTDDSFFFHFCRSPATCTSIAITCYVLLLLIQRNTYTAILPFLASSHPIISGFALLFCSSLLAACLDFVWNYLSPYLFKHLFFCFTKQIKAPPTFANCNPPPQLPPSKLKQTANKAILSLALIYHRHHPHSLIPFLSLSFVCFSLSYYMHIVLFIT